MTPNILVNYIIQCKQRGQTVVWQRRGRYRPQYCYCWMAGGWLGCWCDIGRPITLMTNPFIRSDNTFSQISHYSILIQQNNNFLLSPFLTPWLRLNSTFLMHPMKFWGRSVLWWRKDPFLWDLRVRWAGAPPTNTWEEASMLKVPSEVQRSLYWSSTVRVTWGEMERFVNHFISKLVYSPKLWWI